MITPGTAILSGSAVGYLPAGQSPIIECIEAGDVMIGLASSGIQTNGLSTVWALGEKYPSDAIALYREALKEPSVIYVKSLRQLMREKIRPHYAIHVTGHGWRKLMRARNPFTYVVKNIPETPTIFKMMQSLGKITKREMWGTFNMGIGFVFIVSRDDADRTMVACMRAGYNVYELGHVKNGPKKVRIRPVDITFDERSLQIR